MTNHDMKCAAPECQSRAREGRVCTYHGGALYAGAPWRQQPFAVIAVDPENDWRIAEVVVSAISADEAKRLARAELAKAKRDDWSIRYVRAA
jgi:hypothetical protein